MASVENSKYMISRKREEHREKMMTEDQIRKTDIINTYKTLQKNRAVWQRLT